MVLNTLRSRRGYTKGGVSRKNKVMADDSQRTLHEGLALVGGLRFLDSLHAQYNLFLWG